MADELPEDPFQRVYPIAESMTTVDQVQFSLLCLAKLDGMQKWDHIILLLFENFNPPTL